MTRWNESRVWSRNFTLNYLQARYRLRSVSESCRYIAASVISFGSDRDVTSQDNSKFETVAVQLNGDRSLRNWLNVGRRRVR